MNSAESNIFFNVENKEHNDALRLFQENNFQCYTDKSQQQLVQKQMRDAIRKQFGPLRNQDIFGIAVSYICDFSKTKTNSDLLGRVNKIFLQGLFTAEEIADLEEEKFYCVCGHIVSTHNLFKLINQDTGKWLHIGCSCILKDYLMPPEQLEEMKEIVREHKNKVKREVDKIKYEREEQKRLEETYRKCVTCNKFKIKKTEPSYKTDCLNCYRIKLGYRICNMCREHVIKPDTNIKYKRCYGCNLKKSTFTN